MYSKRTNGNKLITAPDVLEKIAAINHLAVAEVVRLLLVQALPEADRKLGPLELSRPNRVDLMMRRGRGLTQRLNGHGPKNGLSIYLLRKERKSQSDAKRPSPKLDNF
jgi:hypothetical protein